MTLGDALGYKLFGVGAVVLDHSFKFPQGRMPKFCILLEDFDRSRRKTVVALTTTSEKPRGKPWVVELTAGQGGLPEDCRLDLNNVHEKVTTELLHRKYRYVGQLSDDLVDKIYLALEAATLVPEALLIRVFGEA